MGNMKKLTRAKLMIAFLRVTGGQYWKPERASLIEMLEDYQRLLEVTGEDARLHQGDTDG